MYLLDEIKNHFGLDSILPIADGDSGPRVHGSALVYQVAGDAGLVHLGNLRQDGGSSVAMHPSDLRMIGHD